MVLVFNGEIYNYQELRKELIEAGHVFVSNTDSETLIHGYEQWGEKLVDRLRGMYAFCDLGYNIGTEKNKMRPVLVMSNNKINNSEKVVVVCITDAKGKVNARCLPIQDSWFLLYSDTEDEEKQVIPGRTIPASMHTYEFLDKDSMIQCEEIRAVSKARLDANRGCIGTLTPEDFDLVKGKFKRAYNL